MKIIDFALVIGKLKKIKRSGWLRHEIPEPESVAEHSFRSAVLAMILAPLVGADVNKCVKMALIHELGEAKIGDVVTMRGVEALPNLPEKIRAERIAFKEILALANAEEYIKLFDEFEENKSKEAQLVKQVDKFEMGIQAHEYEKEFKGKNLEEFFDSVRITIHNPTLKAILEELEQRRKHNS